MSETSEKEICNSTFQVKISVFFCPRMQEKNPKRLTQVFLDHFEKKSDQKNFLKKSVIFFLRSFFCIFKYGVTDYFLRFNFDLHAN